MKKYLHIVVCVLLVSCSSMPEIETTVRECASMPGGGRASAACFVYNDQAYVFAGRDSAGVLRNDLWRYTPATDQWENLGATPLSARVHPVACVQGNQVFVGLGFNGTFHNKQSYLRDWWSYEPSTNQWTQLKDYPNSNTDCATSFADGNQVIVGYGYSAAYARDMFRYSIATDTWDSIDVGAGMFDYPPRSFGGTGTTCQGRHFMGTGYYRFSLDWWAELLPEGRWARRSAVPGKTRTTAACAASNTYIYLCGGHHYGGVNTTGEVLRDVQRYDPATDSWKYIAIMPEALLNHICFVINGKVYWGLGENKDWKVQNRLYYIAE